jgi:hypothetical protein
MRIKIASVGEPVLRDAARRFVQIVSVAVAFAS